MKPIHTPSGTQEMWCLSEQGLYFFLGRSDKSAALPFQKWVAGNVLPSIKKTGSFSLIGAEERGRQVTANGHSFTIPADRGFSVSVSKTGVVTLRVQKPEHFEKTKLPETPKRKVGRPRPANYAENDEIDAIIREFALDRLDLHFGHHIPTKDVWFAFQSWSTEKGMPTVCMQQGLIHRLLRTIQGISRSRYQGKRCLENLDIIDQSDPNWESTIMFTHF